MNYKIDKGVPIPPRTRTTKYPFGLMEVGDSFEVPSGDRAKIISACFHYNKRKEGRFTVRKVGKDQYRVWRVA